MYRWRKYHHQAYSSIIITWIKLICILSPILVRSDVGIKTCASNRNLKGYSHLESLQQDLKRSKDITVFSICPNISWNMENSEPLIINRSISLRCATTNPKKNQNTINNSCVLSGGNHQVLIQGKTLTIILEGITFQKSKQSSIEISATDSSVTFQNCRWRQHVVGNEGNLIVVNTSVVPINLQKKSIVVFDSIKSIPFRSSSKYLETLAVYTQTRRRRHTPIHRLLQEQLMTSVVFNQCHFQVRRFCLIQS
jgi:hypothetical protein